MTLAWIIGVVFLSINRSDVHAFHLGSRQTVKSNQSSFYLYPSPRSALCYKSKPDEDGSEKTEIEGKKKTHQKNTTAILEGKNQHSVISSTLDNSSYLIDVRSLQDWQRLLEENKDKVISVRFYSHVCKVSFQRCLVIRTQS